MSGFLPECCHSVQASNTDMTAVLYTGNYVQPAILSCDRQHYFMNIFIRQNRQQDRQRTDYIHMEKKYTQQ